MKSSGLWGLAALILFPLSLSAQQRPGLFKEGCGRADPAYIRTATETGGIPMFLQRSEAAKSFNLVRESTRSNVSTVLWAAGVLDGQPQVFEVPVDSRTQRITFTFSFDTDGSSAAIVAPRRGTIKQPSSDTDITDLRCGRIVTVASPDGGNWHLELNGKGRFWVEAQAQSDIYLVTAEFVRIGGRPGHEGWFRIDGQPIAGRPATIRVSFSGTGARITEFYLAGEHGESLRSVQLQPIDASGEFLGTVELPEGPFRIAAKGIDSNGIQFQRFFPALFHTENVEVSWENRFDELPAGSARPVEVAVRNIGNARTFKFTATDGRQFVSEVEPGELMLGPNQSGTVRVALIIPPGTPAVGDDVVILATSTSGPATSNSLVAHFSVTPAADNH